MRITFLMSSVDLSGGSRVISVYADLLARRGHDVVVLIPNNQRRDWRGRIRRFLGRDALSGSIHPSHFDGLEHLVRRLPRSGPIRAADCPEADVVIATWWETAEWMYALPSSKGRKVHFVQGYESFTYTPQVRVHEVLRKNCRKITISRWLEELLRNQFSNTDVVLIPNGVDMKQFHAPSRHRAEAPVVGMLYHTMASKNTRGGIEAFCRLKERFPQAKLVTFGTWAVSDDLPLPSDATHYQLPAQEEIKDIYAACDVWLCSSSSEGFYLPLLEAMACRCPVISTPVGGPLDIIRDGENGFIVPIDDTDAMAAKLIDFFEADGATWDRMSQAAYRTAVAHDWSTAADKFERALFD